MYIYSLEDLVSPADFRRNDFSYPWSDKFHNDLGLMLINFDFNFPEGSGRDDYFEISYRYSFSGPWRDNYSKINNTNHITQEKLESLGNRFEDASYSFNREAGTLCVCVDVQGVRPEMFEDVVQEIHDHFTGIVGIYLTDKLGPCVKHYTSDGDVIERAVP